MTIKKAAVKTKKAPAKKAKPKLEERHIKWLKDNLYLGDSQIKWLIKTFGEERILKTFYEDRDGWTDEVYLESSLNDCESLNGESLPFNCGVFVAEAADIACGEDVIQTLLGASTGGYRHVIITTNHTQKSQFKLLKDNGFEVVRDYMGNPNHGNSTKIAVLMYTFPTTAN